MSIKKVNFDQPILNLNGEPTAQTIGKVLAEVLAIQSKGDPLKFMSWALALHRGEVISLDPSDLETLRQFVTANEQMTNLLKYQILNLLNA